MAAVGLGARSLHAQSDDPSAEPVRIQFVGPADCSDAARFLGEVRARTPRVRAASEGEPARVFHVTVSREGDNALGTLVVEDVERASIPRTMQAGSCEEVVGALALVAALAIDPLAVSAGSSGAREQTDVSPMAPSGPAPGPAASATPPSQSSAPSGSAAPGATPAGGAASRAIRAVLPSASPVGPDGPTPLPSAAPWRLSAGAAFDVLGAAAPSVVVGASAFVEAERDGESSFHPTLRAALAAYGGDAVPAGPGEGRFMWWVEQFDFCPVRFRVASAFAGKPCATAELGVVQADGAGVSNTRSELRPWVSLGAVARLESGFSRFFAIEVYGGVRAPVTRGTFLFQPGLTVYRPAPAMLVGGAGLSVHFP
jgi:hypothetical protein